MMYNPPQRPPRPFEADYPTGAVTDASGRLTHDIDGRPLVAEQVVGRRTLGGSDEAISPAGLVAAGEGSVGASYQTVPPRTLRGDAGRLVVSRDRRSGNAEYDVLLNAALSRRRECHHGMPFAQNRIAHVHVYGSADESEEPPRGNMELII